MKKVTLFCVIAVFSLLSISIGVADEVSGWNGTWHSELYELTFVETDDGKVTGFYIPLDPATGDPGVIEGTVSEDKKIMTGSWSENGTCSFTLSEDDQFFNGTYDSIDAKDQKYTAGWNGTRLADEEANVTGWTGSWESVHDVLHLVQNGSVVTGTYEPKSAGVNDLAEPGIIEGTLSDDGKVFTGIWEESGKLIYTLADDALVFNGTYGYGDDDSIEGSEDDGWNGTRIL